MTEVLFQDYSHPHETGGVAGWVHEVDASSGAVVARVALARGMFHAQLAEKVSGYPHLDIEGAIFPNIPGADGIMVVSYANGPDDFEIVSRILAGGRELRVASPPELSRIVVGLVAVTIRACQADAPRSGSLIVDDDLMGAFPVDANSL